MKKITILILFLVFAILHFNCITAPAFPNNINLTFHNTTENSIIIFIAEANKLNMLSVYVEETKDPIVFILFSKQKNESRIIQGIPKKNKHYPDYDDKYYYLKFKPLHNKKNESLILAISLKYDLKIKYIKQYYHTNLFSAFGQFLKQLNTTKLMITNKLIIFLIILLFLCTMGILWYSLTTIIKNKSR